MSTSLLLRPYTRTPATRSLSLSTLPIPDSQTAASLPYPVPTCTAKSSSTHLKVSFANFTCRQPFLSRPVPIQAEHKPNPASERHRSGSTFPLLTGE
ncbi:hypothetical protein E2C01_074623 [Portunus trituberculatus]|uniref:Uncharacterized protein n=1 Tax=Portunus trituberculatus TaxID=210409 RepID=A0A5B7IDZ1_PORTR|nr:hypothetical protein [Portunus trituberculatus]